MSSPREPARRGPVARAPESREQFERRVACSLVALPFPVPPAIPVEVLGVRRALGAIVICFEDRLLGVPIYLFVTPRDDDGPAFLRTEHLNLGYGATGASDRAESLVARAASRLRASRFEELERALEDKGIGISSLPLSPGVVGRLADGPGDERTSGGVMRAPDHASAPNGGEAAAGGAGEPDPSSSSAVDAGRQQRAVARAEGNARAIAGEPGASSAVSAALRSVAHDRARGPDAERPHEEAREPARNVGPSDGERDTHDGLHETWNHPDRWRMFFADSELKRGRDVIIQCALPWIHIEHGDMECRYVGIGDFVCYPWRSPWERGSHTPHAERPRGADPRGPHDRPQGERDRHENGPARDEAKPAPQSHGFFTDMMDLDVIDGGRDKLVELFELVRELPAVELVSVNCTCVPQIIGDDVAPIVRAERERCSFPILYRDQTSSTYGHHIDAMVEMLRGSAPEHPDPRAVNLVGFREGRGLDELRAWLGRAGARVHVSLIPELRPDLMRRYREASVQVLCPNADWEGMYRHVVGPLELTTLRPVPPYGIGRALGWLDEVLAAVGVRDWSGLRAELETLVAERFEPMVARARSIGVGIVLERGRLSKLLDPARFYSLPLLGVLVEMGFAVRLAVYGRAAERAAVEAELAAAGASFERIAVTSFVEPSELERWLAAPELRLVYSDYGYDYRLTNAAKAPFSAQIFEMGVEGAIRSLERLLRLAHLPLYARAGRPPEGSEAPW